MNHSIKHPPSLNQLKENQELTQGLEESFLAEESKELRPFCTMKPVSLRPRPIRKWPKSIRPKRLFTRRPAL